MTRDGGNNALKRRYYIRTISVIVACQGFEIINQRMNDVTLYRYLWINTIRLCRNQQKIRQIFERDVETTCVMVNNRLTESVRTDMRGAGYSGHPERFSRRGEHRLATPANGIEWNKTFPFAPKLQDGPECEGDNLCPFALRPSRRAMFRARIKSFQIIPC